LFWIAATLAAFVGATRLQRACRGSPFANPVLVSVAVMCAVVLATKTPYASYFAGAQFITFLLGPATVALAVPLARNLPLVRRTLKGVGLALAAGCTTSIVSGVFLVWALGGTRSVALSMAPKGATTPIAMAVSQQIGGVPTLTAALAIVGGIIAAVIGRTLLTRLRVRDPRAHGFAAGVAGSGVAAAQAASLGSVAAAFAALGIALNGVLTALIAPLVLLLWK
jgi:putative effector of murein hydrolase